MSPPHISVIAIVVIECSGIIIANNRALVYHHHSAIASIGGIIIAHTSRWSDTIAIAIAGVIVTMQHAIELIMIINIIP